MKRALIALVSIFSVSAVVAFGPFSDVLPSAQAPAMLATGWFSDDGWGVVATVIAMALIIKRRKG
jgi:hypothetical protein